MFNVILFPAIMSINAAGAMPTAPSSAAMEGPNRQLRSKSIQK
jgi:hypothetical protein